MTLVSDAPTIGDPTILEGERVHLRPLALDDAEALAPIALQDGLLRWFLDPLKDADAVRRWVAAAVEAQAAGTALAFATVDKASGRVVGSSRFMAISRADRRVEIGSTFVDPALQGCGVNVEAKLLMLGHAFDVWGCVRVEFKTDARNERSRGALRALGATEEGTLRRHMRRGTGEWRDSVYFSILDHEWPAVRDRLRARLKQTA